MARIGAKLCQNAFQTIPHISFTTPTLIVFRFFSKEIFIEMQIIRFGGAVLASVADASPKIITSHLFFLSTILGGGVNEAVCVFEVDLPPK